MEPARVNCSQTQQIFLNKVTKNLKWSFSILKLSSTENNMYFFRSSPMSFKSICDNGTCKKEPWPNVNTIKIGSIVSYTEWYSETMAICKRIKIVNFPRISTPTKIIYSKFSPNK